MGKIEYRGEYLDLLRDLTAISKSVIIRKDGDFLNVRRIDSAKMMAYELIAPKEYFNIDRDEISFYEYSEFYQFYKTYKNPALSLDGTRLIISEGKSECGCVLQNPEAIGGTPKKFNFTDPDIKFTLISSDLDQFIKMFSLIRDSKMPRIGLAYEDGEITLKVFNNDVDNTFKKSFECEVLNNTTDNVNFDFTIFSEVFQNLPPRHDYDVYVKAGGFVKVKLIDDNMDLSIITGKVND